MPRERQKPEFGHQHRPWQAYRDAAVSSLAPRPEPTDTSGAVTDKRKRRKSGGQAGSFRYGSIRGRLETRLGKLLSGRLTGTPHTGQSSPAYARPNAPPNRGARRRSDLRLVPAALLVWACSLAGAWIRPISQALICGVFLAGISFLLARRLTPARGGERHARRSVRATLAVGLALAAAAGSHAGAAATERRQGAVAEAFAARASVVAELDITAAPERLAAPLGRGASPRWSVEVTLRTLIHDGKRIGTATPMTVLGGEDWSGVEPGQQIRATGKLKAADAGRTETGTLSASTSPIPLSRTGGTGGDPESALSRLRARYTAAARTLPGDARGLLPGMVTGDTSALDPGVTAAMKTVGMTHLTAVSGANCSLVLGALLLGARSLRLPRPAAAGLALAGLTLFVGLVGPDASVLRAACMGAIGLAAVAAGRAGQALSLLCTAVIVLLLFNSGLAGDFGFLLSVLATLGIIVAGRPVMAWFPSAVPRAVAAGVAVPFSAQLFCGPVIVLLQPSFSTYALAANLAAAVLVAPVTLLGTAAVPLLAVSPALASVPMALAGIFAASVGAVARFFAGLPGAALAWPEGAVGATTMVLMSVVTLGGAWLLCHPARAWRLTIAMHDRTMRVLALVLDGRGWPPRGLAVRRRRGTLRVCTSTLRRNHQWLLPKTHAPRPRPRIPPPGGT